MSNTTTGGDPTSAQPTESPPPPETTPTTPAPPPSTPSTDPPAPTTSSSQPPPPPTTTPPTPSSSPTSAPPSSSSSTSEAPPPPSSSSTLPPPESSSTTPPDASVSSIYVTETRTRQPTDTGTQGLPGASPTSSDPAINPGGSSSGGLSNSGKIAIAVVVPIAAVALLVLAGIFLWRKRKQRKDAEEQRRKEVEDYGYNPNADPTIPSVAGAGAAYEMREDNSTGYRGWGSTTLAGSTGRKASTTMSGGAGASYSDPASPTRNGPVSDTRSGEPLMGDVPPSPEGEILGAMGPSAANNRGDVRRGPSNASSSYSAAGRSDGSGDGAIGVAYGGQNPYYDQYGGNPYTDNDEYGGHPTGAGGQPVIRDVMARRNTRIENPAHYPQQTAQPGISQNF